MNNSHWSSRLAYIIASAGAAIGLGNIWRFPYITGENGGAAFVLIYLGFVILLGIPLMMGEVLVGRRGKKNPAFSYRRIASDNNRSKLWMAAGLLPILAGYLILSYYCVIVGWVLDFFWHSLLGTFQGISVTAVSHLFTNLLDNPMKMLFWDTLAIVATMLVVARGLHRGLEKTIFIVFPVFVVLIIVLIIYAVKSGSFMQGVDFLFKPDFSEITPHGILLALGQAFFSLGIGTGIMLTFGKYVTHQTSIVTTTFAIALADTVVALLAGLTIFPIVFANGLAPDAGPSLIFKTLPVAFGQMPFGELFASLFFIMLALAAFTSTIALLEPAVVYLMETLNWNRAKTATLAGFVIWVLSLPSVASFNIGKHWQLFGKTFFDGLEYLASNVMLPLSGLCVAVFTGWVIRRHDTADELQLRPNGKRYRTWRFAVRYLAPLGILFIFSHALGLWQ